MKEYLKAEWYLYSKSEVRLICGLISFVLYFLTLSLCGIMRPGYCSLVILLGFFAICMLFFPLHTSSIRFTEKGKKKVINKKQLLCLGETMRVFLQVRFLAFWGILLMLLLGGGLSQIFLWVLAKNAFHLESALFVTLVMISGLCEIGIVSLMVSTNPFLAFACGIIGGYYGTVVNQLISNWGSIIEKKLLLKMGILTGVLLLLYLIIFFVYYLLALRSEKTNTGRGNGTPQLQ